MASCMPQSFPALKAMKDLDVCFLHNEWDGTIHWIMIFAECIMSENHPEQTRWILNHAFVKFPTDCLKWSPFYNPKKTPFAGNENDKARPKPDHPNRHISNIRNGLYSGHKFSQPERTKSGGREASQLRKFSPWTNLSFVITSFRWTFPALCTLAVNWYYGTQWGKSIQAGQTGQLLLQEERGTGPESRLIAAVAGTADGNILCHNLA